MIVFWYCHKRGREVRLEKERDLTEQEVLRLDVEWRAMHPGALTTTAAVGASIEDVQAGIHEVEQEQNAGVDVVADKMHTTASSTPST